jgi:hypothetical protein
MKIPIASTARGQYARELRKAMNRTIDPETGGPLMLRGLQRMAAKMKRPYSYEQFRKILSGEPIQSEDCNAIICKILGLNERKMWRFAQSEKALRRFGTEPAQLIAPDDTRLRDIWEQLSEDDREDILRIAEGRLAAKRLSAKPTTPPGRR